MSKPVREQSTKVMSEGNSLPTLDAEIIDLLYAQTFSPDAMSTPASVCEAFSEILLKRWNLCCIVIYLKDDDGYLRERAMHTDPPLEPSVARKVGDRFAAAVERENKEVLVWPDEEGNGQSTGSDLRGVLL